MVSFTIGCEILPIYHFLCISVFLFNHIAQYLSKVLLKETLLKKDCLQNVEFIMKKLSEIAQFPWDQTGPGRS